MSVKDRDKAFPKRAKEAKEQVKMEIKMELEKIKVIKEIPRSISKIKRQVC